MGLEAHQVIDASLGVVLAQLHHGVGLPAGPGVLQAPWFQRAVAQRVMPPAGHNLHRHAALKNLAVLKAVDLCLLCGGKRLPEGVILRLIQRTVDIVRRALIIAGAEPRPLHIHALSGHQRRRGVIKMEVAVLPQKRLKPFRQSIRS